MPDKSQARQVTAVSSKYAVASTKQRKVPDEWQARQAIPVIIQVSSSKHNPSNNKEKKEHVCVCVRALARAGGRACDNEKKMPDKRQAQVTTMILQVSSSKHKAKKSAGVHRVCASVSVWVCVCVTMKKKVPNEWQARQAIPTILQVSSSMCVCVCVCVSQ